MMIRMQIFSVWFFVLVLLLSIIYTLETNIIGIVLLCSAGSLIKFYHLFIATVKRQFVNFLANLKYTEARD